MFTWKTQQSWGKTTTAHKLQKITMRGIQRGENTEATTSCTPSSPHGGYNGGNNLFLSHTHTLTLLLYTGSRYSHNTTIMFHTSTVFALSHIYTHMTFKLFTHMAPRGSLEHIHMCPFQLVGKITTGS